MMRFSGIKAKVYPNEECKHVIPVESITDFVPSPAFLKYSLESRNSMGSNIKKSWRNEFNKKGKRKYKNIRCGVQVETSRGIGHVTQINSNEVIVGYPLKNQISNATSYYEDYAGIQVHDWVTPVDGLYQSDRYADYIWSWIYPYAHMKNAEYEQKRSQEAVQTFIRPKDSTVTQRTVSTKFGSHEYIRVQDHYGRYDVEFSKTLPAIGLADKLAVLHVIAQGGSIQNQMIHGMSADYRIYKRPILDHELFSGEVYGTKLTNSSGEIIGFVLRGSSSYKLERFLPTLSLA